MIGDFSVADPSQFGWFKTASVPLTANGQIDGPWQRPQRGQFRHHRPQLSSSGPVSDNWICRSSKLSIFARRHTIQFRAEAFNFTNHTNLANPNSCVDCPGQAGRIFGAFAGYVPRQWQMALKYAF